DKRVNLEEFKTAVPLLKALVLQFGRTMEPGTKEAAHSASNDPTWCTDVMRSREKSDCQEWGVAIEDPEETFKAIDKDKGG
ncbi:unnamed protein product, partial [Durusdinium trenchii]